MFWGMQGPAFLRSVLIWVFDLPSIRQAFEGFLSLQCNPPSASEADQGARDNNARSLGLRMLIAATRI